MIFVTVGHQTPFDRLVKSVDQWASSHPEVEVFAQIGDGVYEPRHFTFSRWLEPAEFRRHLTDASAVVAHAGTGTILQVLLLEKPLLVMPRRASFQETRNDHQLGTAEHFAAEGLLLSAGNDDELFTQLDNLPDWQPGRPIAPWAEQKLLDRVSMAINGH